LKLILALLLLLTSTAFADSYSDETIKRLHELRASGEFGSLKLEQLTEGNCQVLAGNILMGGAVFDRQTFIKECVGKSISILQQVEGPELPLFVNVAIVTYINYGNLPYAAKNTEAFFSNGNLFFSGIAETAKVAGCSNVKAMQEEKIEIATRFMVNETIAYDVRITYKEMGIISIRYFLDDEYTRYDYNYTCE